MNQADIIKFLSDKYHLPRYAIKQIIDIPFKMMSESFYLRKMESFKIPRLGKFVISPKKKKWIEDNIIEDVLRKDAEVTTKWKAINAEAKLKKDGDQTDSEGVG